MAIFNTESRMLAGKTEAVSGIAETLTSADYDVRVRNVELSTLEVEYSDSDKYLTGDHTHATQTAGLARGTIDSEIQFAVGEFIATGTAGTPIWEQKLPYDKFLMSAGLGVVATDPTDELTNDGKWVIAPEKAYDCSTMTIGLLDVATCDGIGTTGIEYKLKGAMSTLMIESTTTGAPFVFKFSTQGAIDGVTEVTVIPEFDDANTLNTPSARMLNTDIILTPYLSDGSLDVANSINFCTNTFSLDTGSTIAEVLCQQDAYGIKQAIITGRKPVFSVEPMLEKVSDWNWWEGQSTEKVYEIIVIVYEDSAKTIEQLRIEMPRVQQSSSSGSDDNGFRRLSVDYNILRNINGATPREKEHDFTITIGGITIDQTV